ncbi:MAG: lipoyl synthase [Candidatus Omnitrophota bacterium]
MNHLPQWFRQDLPEKETLSYYLNILKSFKIETVCNSAHCPNSGKCLSQNTLTFLILGKACTRNCRFCAILNKRPLIPDREEPLRIGAVSLLLGLKYVVITSVTRDDIFDGGAGQFSQVIKSVRKLNPSAKIEVLIPDFSGESKPLEKIIEAHPEVIGHNIDTVPRLYRKVKDKKSDYKRSLNLLDMIKKADKSVFTKSGLMLGLGEAEDEVVAAMKDLRESGCDILSLGQYLSPSPRHLKVERFILPGEFRLYQKVAISLGFKSVTSGPLVRSSFRAKEQFEKCMMS